MADDADRQEDRPLRERVFSWEEFKGAWRLIRGHGQEDDQ
jgi:hypothetical protein